VYLRGVDVSYPAGRRAVTAGDMDEPTVLLLIGSRTAEPTVRPRSPRPRRCSTSIHSTGCGHQREADALYAISQEDYARSFRALMASLRDLGVAAPIPVAITSYFAAPEGYAAAQAVVRAAQRVVSDPTRGILAGPDTDRITDRFDGCHMGRQGLTDHARAWREVLMRDAIVQPAPA